VTKLGGAAVLDSGTRKRELLGLPLTERQLELHVALRFIWPRALSRS
jgi:hypothetical protein